MASETVYGRYLIKAVKAANGWQARAFRGKSYGAVLSGPTEEAVIAAAQARLDSDNAAQRAMRGADGFPTAVEVSTALEVINISAAQRAMLMAHKAAPNHIMTAAELAKAAGYEDYEVANSQYGIVARRLAEEMGWEPPSNEGKMTWTFALATGADGETRADIEAKGIKNWRWKMRPEVLSALDSESSSLR